MFFEIFRFELRQQLRAPLLWIMAFVAGILAFAVGGHGAGAIGGAVGNVNDNAPIVVVRILLAFSYLGLLLIPAFVCGAALRDFECNSSDLFFTTPMSRTAYLGGRLAAGYAASLFVAVVVAVCLVAATSMPWVDQSRLGPISWAAYCYGLGLFIIPAFMFLAAGQFLLAILTRSMLATYVGVVAFVVIWQISLAASKNLDYSALGALLDPFGAATLDRLTRYWSAQDANTLLPALGGLFLANRLIWLTVSVALIILTLVLFRADHEGVRLSLWRRKPNGSVKCGLATATAGEIPAVTLHSDWRARRSQLLKLAAFDTRHVLRGVPFRVIVLLGCGGSGAILLSGGGFYGSNTYPLTSLVSEYVFAVVDLLLAIVIAFYSGELVWRDRSVRIGSVTDALPIPDAIPLFSKLMALIAMIVVFLAAAALTCVLYQLSRGYWEFEPALYLTYIALNTLSMALLAVLALFLQVLSNNKFLGYLYFAAFYGVSRLVLPKLGLDYHLLIYGTSSYALYSSMNGWGHSLIGHLWYELYWVFAAIVLLVLSAAYWVRGTAQNLKERNHVAAQRVGKRTAIVIVAVVVSFVASGIWIYYNTMVLTTYQSDRLKADWRAHYEKAYGAFRSTPQPKITDVRLGVDIYPRERRVEARGRYILQNKTSRPISELLVKTAAPETFARIKSLEFAGHQLLSEDKNIGFAVYRLTKPMEPGETMSFEFVEEIGNRGFPDDSIEDSLIVDNGTFLPRQFFPVIGYDRNIEISDPKKRRDHGLPPTGPTPGIYDKQAQQFSPFARDADWINFETTLSTDSDQIAVSPGNLVSEWTVMTPQGGRRYFHYKMDKPIVDFYVLMSARYQVRRETWNGISLEVYYHPPHAFSVDGIMAAMKAALECDAAAFTPYQFRQLRVIEFPSSAPSAQSYPNTLAISERAGFITDPRNSKVDKSFETTTHEVSHQWWGHQVSGADVEGMGMLTESFANYSALRTIEHQFGKGMMRTFLRYELDAYLSGRAAEVDREVPLALTGDQDYIKYSKGSLVTYAARNYLGEDVMNRAMSRYAQQYAFQPPPYPTTMDFLAILKEEAGPAWESFIDDLFTRISLFDNRVIEAKANRLPNGRYEVIMRIHSAKFYNNGIGLQTPAPMDVPVDIGVFGKSPAGGGGNGKVLFLERRKVTDGDSVIKLVVDDVPAEVGIDPYNVLIDRIPDDNRMPVVLN